MNIQALMKQAKSLQTDMMKAQEEINKMVFTGESSLVKVIINGQKIVQKIEIKKDQNIGIDEIEMLEDMILLAFNNALLQVDKVVEEKMGRFNNNFPGLF